MSNSNGNMELEGEGEAINANVSLSPDTMKALEELRLVEPIISELTGLPSNWNGNLELRSEPGWRGMKPFGCAIRLDSARQELDVRWRTHLHEAVACPLCRLCADCLR